MRILVVSQYFWPENFRINDLCEELSKRGHEVVVLTGEPNYPSGEKFVDYVKNPNDYNNYKNCEIVRVPIVPRGSKSVGLALNYISYFVFASTIGLWRLRKRQFDVVFVCQLSPITIAIPAIIYKRFTSTPIVMWVLDLWPDSLRAVGVANSEKVLKLVNILVNYIYKKCDLILGQSRSITKSISENSPSDTKVDYFPSWAETIFENLCGEKRIYDGKLRLLFAGNVGEAQDLKTVINALAIAKKSGQKFTMSIVGDGRALSSIKELVKTLSLENCVIFHGRHPLESMPTFYASADVLLVSLKSDPVFANTIPGKVQSYMIAAKPILAMLDGEGADVILRSGAGLVATPGSAIELSDKIAQFASLSHFELLDMGAKGRKYATKEFNRDNLISDLLRHFDSVVGSGH